MIIDNRQALEKLQYASVARALAIEIVTGLRHSRGSVMNLAKSHCNSPKRTKKGVLKDYVAWLQKTYPDYVIGGNVAKALAD